MPCIHSFNEDPCASLFNCAHASCCNPLPLCLSGCRNDYLFHEHMEFGYRINAITYDYFVHLCFIRCRCRVSSLSY